MCKIHNPNGMSTMKTPEKMYGISSKLTIKTPERYQRRRSDVSIGNFEHV